MTTACFDFGKMHTLRIDVLCGMFYFPKGRPMEKFPEMYGGVLLPLAWSMVNVPIKAHL